MSPRRRNVDRARSAAKARTVTSQRVEVPHAGVLSGDGATLVRALVYHHPTPQRAPSAFAEIVDPIRDIDSSIHDWRLSTAKLLAHRDSHVHDIWSAFAAWRRSYVAERYIGDVARVLAFLRWAEGRCDIDALRPIALPKTGVDHKTALRAAWQLHEAELECRRGDESGLGVTSPHRRRLARGFLVDADPVLVLADRDATITADRSSFTLTGPAVTSLTVRGWLVETPGVTAVSDEGPVPLGGAPAGRLLMQVAPSATQASVRPVPLTEVFAGLFTGLREMAKLAAADHARLVIRRGAPTG